MDKEIYWGDAKYAAGLQGKRRLSIIVNRQMILMNTIDQNWAIHCGDKFKFLDY
ncbi:MAG TPA: hypothetical protein PK918_08435 [Methanotrichaceae archaeon]|nr:hypothetical protein [Methanotrichaceae archaeon]HQI92030.1 hypothetical protein [Methanotrichaceae archaeon]